MARSFEHAYRGMISAVRTQRNMRFHVVVAVVVLVASLFVGVSRIELAFLILTILLVFVTELFNTAMEFVVDLATKEYHPLAKLAKDVSAGAVLVSSVGAVLVGYLVLADDLGPLSLATLESIRRSPAHLTLVSLGVVVLVVLLGKAITHSPNTFAGGMPSGHAAVAFAGWVAASFIAVEAGAGSYAGLVSVISLLMALLVCQSRVESGLHSVYQVIVGAVIGILDHDRRLSTVVRGEGLDPRNRNGGRASGLRTSLRPVQQLPGRRGDSDERWNDTLRLEHRERLVRALDLRGAQRRNDDGLRRPGGPRHRTGRRLQPERLAVLPLRGLPPVPARVRLQRGRRRRWLRTPSLPIRADPTQLLRTGRPALNCELGIRSWERAT